MIPSSIAPTGSTQAGIVANAIAPSQPPQASTSVSRATTMIASSAQQFRGNSAGATSNFAAPLNVIGTMPPDRPDGASSSSIPDMVAKRNDTWVDMNSLVNENLKRHIEILMPISRKPVLEVPSMGPIGREFYLDAKTDIDKLEDSQKQTFLNALANIDEKGPLDALAYKEMLKLQLDIMLKTQANSDIKKKCDAEKQSLSNLLGR